MSTPAAASGTTLSAAGTAVTPSCGLRVPFRSRRRVVGSPGVDLGCGRCGRRLVLAHVSAHGIAASGPRTKDSHSPKVTTCGQPRLRRARNAAQPPGAHDRRKWCRKGTGAPLAPLQAITGSADVTSLPRSRHVRPPATSATSGRHSAHCAPRTRTPRRVRTGSPRGVRSRCPRGARHPAGCAVGVHGVRPHPAGPDPHPRPPGLIAANQGHFADRACTSQGPQTLRSDSRPCEDPVPPTHVPPCAVRCEGNGPFRPLRGGPPGHGISKPEPVELCLGSSYRPHAQRPSDTTLISSRLDRPPLRDDRPGKIRYSPVCFG